VDYAGAAEQHSHLAFPMQCPTALAAEMARPAAVEDFSQRSEHFGFCLRAHRKDRAEVFEHHDAELVDLPEQSAFSAPVLLFFWHAAEQSCWRQRCGFYDIGKCRYRIE